MNTSAGSTILRSEAIKIINSGRPFDSLEFVTADQRRGTGGDLVHKQRWQRITENMKMENLPTFFRRNFERQNNTHSGSRATKHFVIFNPASLKDHPITVHYWLMVSLNGKRIING